MPHHSMEVSDIEIYWRETDGPLTFFKGRARVSGSSIEFDGLLFQSVGGPNVSVKLSDESARILSSSGFNEEQLHNLEVELQLKIIAGELVMAGARDERRRNIESS